MELTIVLIFAAFGWICMFAIFIVFIVLCSYALYEWIKGHRKRRGKK